MRFIKTILLLVFLLQIPAAHAQLPLSDNAKITLLTCGPGDELYSVFGHTAIRVYDPATAMDVVYNYGMFDFGTPNFYLKFIKGDLQYYVGADSYRDFVYTYQYYNRNVFEQELNLTQAEKQQVADALAQSLVSDDKYYTYKFIDRNCTTKAADVIKAVIPGRISRQNTDGGKTNRAIIQQKLHNKFYESLGINLMFGAKTDRLQYNLFLPQQLLEGVGNTQLARGPLAQPVKTVYRSTQPDTYSWWNNYYTFAIIMFALALLSRYRSVRMGYFLLGGLLGVLFCTVGVYSLHNEVTENYSIFLLNPLLLLLPFVMAARKAVAVRFIIYICFACIVVYLVIIYNKPHLVMMLPVLIVTLAMLVREITATRKYRLKQF